ncbi:glycosyltransferase family A protein [Aurantimicrobium minutum]|uniref:glycosyltransferase family A protein n=1 Tax=Aurantimicrobium minutum TaxID=708131 RepID=UPI00248E6BD6|nr:glycosyltransferase family 2 protein [Aurantimicrobium minutum]
MGNPLVTVAILTFNGEKYLEEIFTKVSEQHFPHEFEILVIDSGSTDSTLNIIRSHQSVRLHEIPNTEFGHGKTRNLAAELARGEYIAFLTHDAIPAHEFWLSNLVAPLILHPEVAGVLGKQAPRKNCVPMLKYEIQLAFSRQGANFGITLLNQHDVDFASSFDKSAMLFYSDVNSATRVDFLRSVIPYKDVDYAEDQMFAEDFLSNGYSKAYSPQATVIHSNDLDLSEIGPRTFDEILALRKLGHQLHAFSPLKFLGVILKKTLGDTIRMVRDTELNGQILIHWLFLNPMFIFRKWKAYNRACRVDFGDKESISKSSLEARKKAVQ